MRHADLLLKSRKVDIVCFLETKMNNASKMVNMGCKLGFTHNFMVDSLGFAGGLLFLWNLDTIDLEIVQHQHK